MVFDLHLTVYYREKRYYYFAKIIDEDTNYCDDYIDLIILDYMIYKDYIKDMLAFLNREKEKERSDQGWTISCPLYNVFTPNCVYKEITISDEKIVIRSKLVFRPIAEVLEIEKVVTPEFIEFINRRFLLQHICNKYNLPKDLHAYLINFF